MLGKLKHSLFGFNKVAGIELILSGEETVSQIKLVLLSLNKNLLSIEKMEAFSNMEDLRKFISSDTPVSLTLTGKGIITKKVADAEISDQNNFIDQIFPNANAAEFYIQKFQGIENFISIIRRNKVDETIQEIESLEFNVVSVSLGPFSVVHLLPHLNRVQTDLFSFSGHHFILKNGLLNEYKQRSPEGIQEEIQIDKEQVKENQLIAYAAAFGVFSGGSGASVEEEAFLKSKDEFKQKKIFKSLSRISASVLLFILLLNVYFYFHLKNENKNLGNEESRYQSMILQLEGLEKQVKEKESFLNEAGWMTFSKASYYSDRIASTVPTEIKLTEMSMNPINDKLSKAERKLIFNSGYIKLMGNCRNPTDLNPWIKKMKIFEWVKEVAIQSYFYNEKNREGVFNIEVTIK